jgi:hypothetical protein
MRSQSKGAAVTPGLGTIEGKISFINNGWTMQELFLSLRFQKK